MLVTAQRWARIRWALRYIDDGLQTAVFTQVIDEIRRALPAVIGSKVLRHGTVAPRHISSWCSLPTSSFFIEGPRSILSLSLSSSLHYDNQHTRNTHTHPAWAYKYDNSAGADGAAVASDGDTSDGGASDGGVEGIPIHADGADVNVNFWITPDAANRDDGGESGGLVVHPAHRGSQVLAT